MQGEDFENPALRVHFQYCWTQFFMITRKILEKLSFKCVSKLTWKQTLVAPLLALTF